MRGSAADAIFMLAPMVPAPDEPKPRLVWLMTLKASARAYSVIFSWSLNMRERETSRLNFPGDRQDCQRISGKVSQKFMAVLSVPGIPRNVIRVLA
jgi:hypothetical protein